jgi:redox-sensitive bicupin YhaK (pirin superfamily)
MIGAWCFVDHYGPEDIAGQPGMRVPPHPHTGLQTVSWLFDGEILHRDGLGSLQRIRPGELNLMTAGQGIAHSEESPPDHPPALHGVQLWVALPAADRATSPMFEHHAGLPVVNDTGISATVLVGEFAGVRSPGTTFTPLVGVDVALEEASETRLPLESDFEYGAVVTTGRASIDGAGVVPGDLLYLGCGRSDLPVHTDGGARVLLLGGEPFDEEIVMWWNFIGRSHDEIVAFREDWASERRFAPVHGYDGGPLPAPPLPATRLRPRGRVR